MTLSGMMALLVPEVVSTIYMLVFSTMISLVLGILIALIMICTYNDGLYPNRIIYGVIEVMMDMLMSMPFVVLAVAMIPFTRLLVGTCIGRTAALVPLTAITTPIFVKFTYDALLDTSGRIEEAARSFGASNISILLIMLKESIPAVISGITVSTITTLNSVSMAGIVGAGGIGSIAISYGYHRGNYKLIWLVVIFLIAFTEVIQLIGDCIYKKLK